MEASSKPLLCIPGRDRTQMKRSLSPLRRPSGWQPHTKGAQVSETITDIWLQHSLREVSPFGYHHGAQQMLVKRDPQRGGEMGGGARPTIEDKETGRMRQTQGWVTRVMRKRRHSVGRMHEAW